MKLRYIVSLGITSLAPLFVHSFVLPSFGEGEAFASMYQTRNYWRQETEEEVEALRFIVTSLSNVPLLKLRKLEEDLENAGGKIDKLHPLNTWRIIFTDDEMIGYMHNIRNRKIVWKRFIKQMGDSLELSYERGEIDKSHIEDFSQKVGIDFSLIFSQITSHRWEDFVKQLLVHVKRKDDSGRYHM
jgi:hypothetical protein